MKIKLLILIIAIVLSVGANASSYENKLEEAIENSNILLNEGQTLEGYEVSSFDEFNFGFFDENIDIYDYLKYKNIIKKELLADSKQEAINIFNDMGEYQKIIFLNRIINKYISIGFLNKSIYINKKIKGDEKLIRSLKNSMMDFLDFVSEIKKSENELKKLTINSFNLFILDNIKIKEAISIVSEKKIFTFIDSLVIYNRMTQVEKRLVSDLYKECKVININLVKCLD